MNTVILPEQLFDGTCDGPLENKAIIIENELIVDVVDANQISDEQYNIIRSPIAAPGFIDLQINGAGDAQFNENPTLEALTVMASGARIGGTAYILPTFITAPKNDYQLALEVANQAVQTKSPGIIGIHLEGPFLSPKRHGIHPIPAIRSIDETDIVRLCKEQAGSLLVTLAPEEMISGAIARLNNAGVIVFAGHSAASFSDMVEAQSEGLSGATHLFNVMSQVEVREPGVVGAVLNSKTLFAGIIADGYHVHPANICLALEALSSERLFLVTDAMKTLGGTNTTFKIDGNIIKLDDGRLTDKTGRLAGAHLSLDEALRNIIKFTGIQLVDALRMASTTPAKVLHRFGELGVIAKGARAGVTLLNEDLYSTGVVVDGAFF